jgi:hypothetical protein
MRAMVRHVFVTPRNCVRIRVGILLPHYAIITCQGRSGFLIIRHAARRTGICFEERLSEGGRWCSE